MLKYIFTAGLLASSATLFAQEPVSDAPAVTEERPAEIATAAFAQLSFISGAKLSPDGSRFASVMEIGGMTSIVLFDANTGKPTGKFGIGDKNDLEWFRWAGNQKILFSISKIAEFYGEDARFTRLHSVDIINSTLEYLGVDDSIVDGDNVIYVADDASHLLLSIQRDVREYPSVMRIDLTGESRPRRIQSARDGVWNWYADDAGAVRLGTGWRRDRLRVFYRPDADSSLKEIASLKEGDGRTKYWDVARIASGSDEGYVLSEDDDGRIALRKFNYATQEVLDTVYSNPDWDLDAAWLGKDGEPVFATYTDDRDQIVWFDDKMASLQELLNKSMKEQDAWITSRSDNDTRMLIWGGGEADPGALYMYTPAEKSMRLVAEMRPNMNVAALSKPKPIDYTARDGTKIRAYLTLPRGREAKDLPLILMPHGGPYGVRDKLAYNDEVQLFANRGYAVLQPNYRGSDGYGKVFAKLGTGQIGRKMQDDLDDAVKWAVEQGTVDADRVCIVGGSYGGYAALWGVIRNPEIYRCAASWAGVTDWDAQLKYDKAFFSRKGGKKWRARIEGEDFDLDSVSPATQVEGLIRPVLLAHGKDDTNVPYKQYRTMLKAAKKADKELETLLIDDEGHSFSKPENEKAWYDTLLGFLAKHNPAD